MLELIKDKTNVLLSVVFDKYHMGIFKGLVKNYTKQMMIL